MRAEQIKKLAERQPFRPFGVRLTNGSEYDNSDNLLKVKDALNHVYTNTYDLLNRKLSLKYPDNSIKTYAYDAVGNMTSYTTRAGQVRTSTFDNRNRESGFTWSDSTPAVAKSYDAAGRTLTLNNSASNLSYSYDAANQVLSETQQIAATGVLKTTAYTYDGDGNRATIVYPSAL